MKFPQIYAWMNKCIWTDASIIYTDQSPQVSPSKAKMNTNCFDGSSVHGIWLWNAVSPCFPEYILSTATLASRGENKKAIIPSWGCWCGLSRRWQMEKQNELRDKVKKWDWMQRSKYVSKPGTNLIRVKNELVNNKILFICSMFGSYPKYLCFILLKTQGKEVGEVTNKSKVT